MQLEPFRVQPALLEWKREDYLISSNPALLDLDVIHGFLTRSTWAAGIPRETVQLALANSFAFGLYKSGGRLAWRASPPTSRRSPIFMEISVQDIYARQKPTGNR